MVIIVTRGGRISGSGRGGGNGGTGDGPFDPVDANWASALYLVSQSACHPSHPSSAPGRQAFSTHTSGCQTHLSTTSADLSTPQHTSAQPQHNPTDPQREDRSETRSSMGSMCVDQYMSCTEYGTGTVRYKCSKSLQISANPLVNPRISSVHLQ